MVDIEEQYMWVFQPCPITIVYRGPFRSFHLCAKNTVVMTVLVTFALDPQQADATGSTGVATNEKKLHLVHAHVLLHFHISKLMSLKLQE